MCDDQAIPGPGRSLRRRFLFCTISSTSCSAGRPKKAVFKSVDRLVFAGLYPLVPGVPDALKSLQPDTKVPEALSISSLFHDLLQAYDHQGTDAALLPDRARRAVGAIFGWRAIWEACKAAGRVGRIWSSRESILPAALARQLSA
jgi:hypothetical protein